MPENRTKKYVSNYDTSSYKLGMQPCVDQTNLLICSVVYTVVLPYELQTPTMEGSHATEAYYTFRNMNRN